MCVCSLRYPSILHYGMTAIEGIEGAGSRFRRRFCPIVCLHGKPVAFRCRDVGRSGKIDPQFHRPAGAERLPRVARTAAAPPHCCTRGYSPSPRWGESRRRPVRKDHRNQTTIGCASRPEPDLPGLLPFHSKASRAASFGRIMFS